MLDCMKWLFHSYNETINFKKVHFRCCLTVDGSSLHLAASLGLVKHSHKMHLAFEVDLQGLVQNPHSSLGNTRYPQRVYPQIIAWFEKNYSCHLAFGITLIEVI